MSDSVVQVDNLHRHFGLVQAVRGVSFELIRGQVVGFIGPNGSGKTTTMRMMVTLDQPDQGTIRINGVDVAGYPNKVRDKIGWMPDSFGRYEMTTVHEYLDFYCRAFGYHGRERQQRVDEVMTFTDLTSIADRYMDTLSKGMGQRLCLGRTLLHDPEVLILDEPAAGLDPKARIELRNLVSLLAAEGKTILISSHILSELGEMCDTMLFIDNGKIVYHGSSEKLKSGHPEKVVINVRLTDSDHALDDWVSMNPGVTLVDRLKNGGRVELDQNDPEFVAAVLRRMIQDGLPVVEFSRAERNLEEAFIDILKNGDLRS